MTAQELRQIYYLNQELKMWQEALEKLRMQALAKGQKLTGMPHVSGISDPVGDLAAEIEETINIIKGLQAKIRLQTKHIIAWIETVDDSYMRQIIYLRNVECLKWEDVVTRMDMLGSTANAIKKQYYKFLKANK